MAVSQQCTRKAPLASRIFETNATLLWPQDVSNALTAILQRSACHGLLVEIPYAPGYASGFLRRSDGMERLLSSECVQVVSYAGLEFYGLFECLASSGVVNQFALETTEKHADGLGKVARGVLAAFTQAVFEATASEGKSGADIVSLTCDFIRDARAGDRIKAEVKVVRRTTSLMFLTADITGNGRILLTANGVAKRS